MTIKKYLFCLILSANSLFAYSFPNYSTNFAYLNHTAETYKAIYRHRETCEGHVRPNASELIPTGSENHERVFAQMSCPIEPIPSPIVNHSRINIVGKNNEKVSLNGTCHIVGSNRLNIILHTRRVNGILLCLVIIEKSHK